MMSDDLISISQADISKFTNAPAPWACKYESYCFPLWSGKDLPDGAYHPLEASIEESHNPKTWGEFKGGLGAIMVIRYSESPVGPYDELMYIPGYFTNPKTKSGKASPRITRIYVSQPDSVYNGMFLSYSFDRIVAGSLICQGRKNWNIPKHLARFQFSSPPVSSISPAPKTLTIEVFAPNRSSDEEDRPFFKATIQPFTWTPSFPVSTAWASFLGINLDIVCPPLPASNNTEEAELCGTKTWKTLTPVMKSKRARGMWINSIEVTKADDEGGESTGGNEKVWFPQVNCWGTGLWMENAELIFGIPTVLVEPDL